MGGMGTSTQSSTEQSQTSYPQWTQDAQANTFSVGRGQLENFLRNPQYSVAGTTTDMLKGYDLARETAQQAYTAPQLRAPGSPNLTASTIDASMNPYLKAVGDTTLDSMRREYGNADAALASKYAAGNMMGGSGEAIARGQAARGYNQNVASTIAQIQSAGFDKSREAALANMQAENAMKTTGADYGLKATQVDDTLRTTNQARQMSALQQLLQGGQMQQQQNQQVLDVPWTALERLFGITPKQMNSQTYSQKESPDNSTSPLQSILGFGSTILGAKTAGGGSIAASLLGLSDEREKTDIQKLGKDPETGLQLYSYRYKGDPKTYPKMTGPMAQEVEDAYPGSTRNVGGRMAVPLDMLMNAGKKKGA